MSNHNNRKSVRFSTNVPANDSRTLTFSVDQEATIEQVDVRIYTGPRLDLHVRPFAERHLSGDNYDRNSLVTLIGKDYIDGDGDEFTFYPTESVKEGDRVGMEAINTDTQHPYDITVDVLLDREGGSQRGATSFLGGLF